MVSASRGVARLAATCRTECATFHLRTLGKPRDASEFDSDDSEEEGGALHIACLRVACLRVACLRVACCALDAATCRVLAFCTLHAHRDTVTVVFQG
jgi:hypothetical protein